MFVEKHMSSPVVTVPPDLPFQDALKLMQERKFRRLPVVNKQGKLVGIISERDLLYASPSPATTLSVWEMNYLLSKIDVQSIMTKKVITITPGTTVEDAASIMIDKKIGGLPVLDGNTVAGIITETDIFRILVGVIGGGQPGLRLSLEVPRKRGVLADLSKAIFDQGGFIVSVGSFPIEEKPEEDGLVIKVRDVSKGQLVDTLEKLGDRVTDAREV
ncbi:MAG: CBS domain-containing protein [Anaerolineae bacterium]